VDLLNVISRGPSTVLIHKFAFKSYLFQNTLDRISHHLFCVIVRMSSSCKYLVIVNACIKFVAVGNKYFFVIFFFLQRWEGMVVKIA